MTDYPEHTKLSAIQSDSWAIGAFLDTSKYVLAEWAEPDGYRNPQLLATGRPIAEILAEYFDIDLNKIETEKRAMLDAIRESDH